MWVYRQTEGMLGALWAVGFYAPDGEWVEDKRFANKEDAAQRAHWLNGGGN